MKKYTIYIHISPSNKIYIGQTCNITKRWSSFGENYKTCPYFYNAIKKYGWNNFKHIIVKENLSKEEANKLEIELIKKYNSTDPNKGYNILGGGSGALIITDELYKQKQKIMIDKWKNKDFQEKVRINSNKKLVQCLNNGNIFYSCEKAAKWCNVDAAGIRRCCEGIRYHAGKHPETKEELYWMYISKEDNKLSLKQCQQKILEIKEKEFTKRSKNNGVNKQVKCLNTNEIFYNISSAAKWCNLSSGNGITRACKKGTTAGKHPKTGEPLKWEFMREDKDPKDCTIDNIF